MAEHLCCVEDGWAGISKKLALAAQGDVVSIADGEFLGAETLTMPSGVQLSGSGRTRLLFSGDGPAIMAKDAVDVSIENLTIEAIAKTVTRRALPWDAPMAKTDKNHVEWGLIFLDGCHSARLCELVLTGRTKATLIAAAIRCSESIQVNQCHAAGFGGGGFYFISSIGCNVTDNSVTGCWNGIALFRSSHHFDRPSYAEAITNNRCNENTQNGIILFSSQAERIEDNECSGNKTKQGISLTRSRESTSQPSTAKSISRNRCHHNGIAGIVLFGSESVHIESNECHNNKSRHGICAQYFDKEGDIQKYSYVEKIQNNICSYNHSSGIAIISSKSSNISNNKCLESITGHGISISRNSISETVSNNKCHHNNEIGISVSLSQVRIIEFNECWGSKKLDGILIEKESYVEKVLNNKLYDNERSGIMLLSSISNQISNNECSDNRDSGISLRRHKDSPEKISYTHELNGNICFGNSKFGIELTAPQETVLDANRAWNNGLMPNFTFTESQVVTKADFDPANVFNRQHRHTLDGSLADILDETGTRQADKLAQFVSGPGCASCLSSYWHDGNGMMSRAGKAAEDRGTDRIQEQKWAFTFSRVDEVGRFVFQERENETASLTNQFWNIVRKAVDGAPSVTILGVVSADEAPVSSFVEQLHTAIAHQQGDPNAITALSVPSLLHALDRKGAYLNEPLVVNCAPRSAALHSGVPLPYQLLEEELAAGRPMWKERLVQYGLSPAPWFQLLAGATFAAGFAMFARFKGYTGPPSDVFGALRYFVVSVATNAQPWDVFPAVAAIIGGPALLLLIANRSLPSRLQILPDWTESRLANVGWLTEPLRKARSQRPWLRWAKRRVFGGLIKPTVSTLVLSDPDGWHEHDKKALLQLASTRDMDQSLVIIVHMRSRSQITGGLMALCEIEAAGFDPSVLGGFEVLLLGEEQPTDLRSAADSAPSPHNLLGLAKFDTNERNTMLAAIRDDRWSVRDLLPMLVLGSTASSPMRVSRPVAVDDFTEEFISAVEPYARLVAGDASLSLTRIDAGSLEQLHRAISAVPAAHVVRRSNRGHNTLREYYDYYGRSAYRQAMADCLSEVFGPGNEDRFRVYGETLMACGELYNLMELEALATKGLRDQNILSRIERHLSAALQLRTERGGRAAPSGSSPSAPHHGFEEFGLNGESDAMPASPQEETRERMLVERRARVFDILSALRPPMEQGLRHQAIQIYLRLLTLAHPATEDLSDLLISNAEPTEAPETLRECLYAEIAPYLKALCHLDRNYSIELLTQQLRTEWSVWPQWLKNKIQLHVEQDGAFDKTLSKLLTDATTDDELRYVVELHQGISSELLGVAYLLGARAAKDDHQRLQLAETIAQHRTAGLALAEADRISRFYTPEDNFGLEKVVRIGEIIAELDQQQTWESDLGEEVVFHAFGAFSPVNGGEIERIWELVFERKRRRS